MSYSRNPAKEGFIDRHQLWPFYRRRRYCDETMAEIEDTNRLISEHYNPRENGDLKVSRNEHRRENARYALVEKARYLKGRERMADRGYDLEDLDLAIDLLCRGYELPREFRNHKLKGDMKGYMECHIGFDWVLVYRYDGDNPILYAVDTGTHMDVSGNRSLRW